MQHYKYRQPPKVAPRLIKDVAARITAHPNDVMVLATGSRGDAVTPGLLDRGTTKERFAVALIERAMHRLNCKVADLRLLPLGSEGTQGVVRQALASPTPPIGRAQCGCGFHGPVFSNFCPDCSARVRVL